MVHRSWPLIIWCLLLIVLGHASGCSKKKAHYTPLASPIAGMETYRILQVDPVTVPPGELELLVDAGGLVTTRRSFIEEFTRHRLMPVVAGSTPESEDVLIVRTTVASWDPGDAGARFFIGFVGAAKLGLRVELVDKATQTCIGETIFTMKESGDGCDVGALGKKMAPTVRMFIERRGQ